MGRGVPRCDENDDDAAWLTSCSPLAVQSNNCHLYPGKQWTRGWLGGGGGLQQCSEQDQSAGRQFTGMGWGRTQRPRQRNSFIFCRALLLTWKSLIRIFLLLFSLPSFGLVCTDFQQFQSVIVFSPVFCLLQTKKQIFPQQGSFSFFFIFVFFFKIRRMM